MIVLGTIFLIGKRREHCMQQFLIIVFHLIVVASTVMRSHVSILRHATCQED